MNQLIADSPPFFINLTVLLPSFSLHILSRSNKNKILYSLFILLLFLGCPGITSGQSINFEDGFNDGDFTHNPTWYGDIHQFIVADTDSNLLLQLKGDNKNGDISYLSTASTNTEGAWDFFVDLGFKPSNSNRADIFLMSDIADLEGEVNGYAVRAGEYLSEDVFRIVRYENGTEAATVLSGSTDISSGGAFRVKVKRSIEGEWKMEVAQNYDGILKQEGDTQSDNTFTSANYFGLRATYTLSNAENFFFDFKIDLPPFTVIESTAKDNNVRVIFNRPYDQSTVESTDFYIDKNLGTPSSVTFTDDTTITLIYNSTILSDQYTISVNNINDLNGETIGVNVTSLFTVFGDYNYGDVIINEFVYDPPANFGVEYIELKNTTGKYMDLREWIIVDSKHSKMISPGNLILEPDSFIVVSKDTTALSELFGNRAYVQSSIPALNNNGDIIKIITDRGATADSLAFTSDWGGTDIALERRSAEAASYFPENWGNSPNPRGGTPGSANEIASDTTPPVFEDLVVKDATTLKLTFSENINRSSATDRHNYQIIPATEIQVISVQGNNITLFLTKTLRSGEIYEVAVSNISDIFGNILSKTTKKVEYLRIEQAKSGDLVINEILYNPGTGEADFIELYNRSNKNFDLRNWIIGDSNNETSITLDIQIRAKSYLVLTGSDQFAQNSDKSLAVNGFPALNNKTPDDIYLRTNNNLTIDSLRYHQSWGGHTRGTSLERIDPHTASNDASKWQTSKAISGNSAGQENASFQADTKPPDVIFCKALDNGTIELQFNEFIRLTADVKFLVNGQPLNVNHFDSTKANTITLTSKLPKSSTSDNTIITIQNLSDIKGNITSNSRIPISLPLEQSAIVINEIMFNPLADPYDKLPDQSEYIELVNTRDHAVSLEGLVLHDAPDENNVVRKLIPVSSNTKWVPARGQILVHADEATFFEESRIASFFNLNSSDLRSVMRVDRSSLSLSSTKDAIYLADSTGITIDSVHYSEEWHNPNIVDTRGIALERIAPTGVSNDQTNWGSSVNEKGGTPHSENSIYQENINRLQKSGLGFMPNPFSPDSDGHEDNLTINYKLDHQDYLIDVQIYNRYGQVVRELADGKQAGFEGQLIWDGRKNDGSRNRIGIYIVVFEAYGSMSGGNQTFKETIVLARRLN